MPVYRIYPTPLAQVALGYMPQWLVVDTRPPGQREGQAVVARFSSLAKAEQQAARLNTAEKAPQ